MADEQDQFYTAKEEVVHAITHGLGIALSIAGLSVMVVRAGFSADAFKIVSTAVFGASMVLLYTFSTLYHTFRKPRLKRVFRILDHSCIYILIAGTYTPFTLISIRGGWGWSLFGVIWGLALSGIIFKIFLTGRLRFLSLTIYLGMGWLAIIAFGPIIAALPAPALFWLTAGGLFYTFGVIFYAWTGLRYHHAVWHVFVLGGTTCHFLSIYFYVLPLTA